MSKRKQEDLEEKEYPEWVFSRTLFGNHSDSYRFIAEYMTDEQIETNIMDSMHYDQAFNLMEILEEEERSITETMLTLLVSIAKVDLDNQYECYVPNKLTNDGHMLRLFKFVIKHSNLIDIIADEKFPLQLFHIALDNCFLKCLDYLLSAGVDVNTREGLLPWISVSCKYDLSKALPVIEIFLKYRFDFRMKHAKKNLFESITYSEIWRYIAEDSEARINYTRLITYMKELERQDKVFKNTWDLWGILKSKDGVNKVFLSLNYKPREVIEETLDNLVKNRCEQDLEKETVLYYELCELLEPFTTKVEALENYAGFILGEKE